MDITIQAKSLMLASGLVRRDYKDMQTIPYVVPKKPYAPVPSVPLERTTPHSAGVPNWTLDRFYAVIGADRSIMPHSMLVMRHGKIICEGNWAPYTEKVPHMLFSMSKTVTATAIGIAVGEGLFKLDDKAMDLLHRKYSATSKRNWKNLTIRDLLVMSTGTRFNELGSMLDEDWVKMFFESNPRFEAGTQFEYNSLNSYILAAILEEQTGVTMVEYLRPRLFDPLGIGYAEWETCPKGIAKGGWGLSLLLEDAAKIGLLYLNKGVYQGKRILSESWTTEATRKQIDTPNGEATFGYGYHIWMNPMHGAYQFNGAFGQYVVVLPEYDAIVTLYSGSSKLFANSILMDEIEKMFKESSKEPIAEDSLSSKNLKKRIDSLCFDIDKSPLYGNMPEAYDELLDFLGEKEYIFDAPVAGLFTESLSCVHGNYSLGARMMRFKRRERDVELRIYENDECNTVIFSGDSIKYTSIAINGEVMLQGTRAMYYSEKGVLHLLLLTSLIETPFTRVMEFTFDADKLSVTFDEAPSVTNATSMLLDLVGLSKTALLKYAMREAKTKGVPSFVERFVAPTATARLTKNNDPETNINL